MNCRDGASDRVVQVPDGFDYEIHNRKDIEKRLGDKAWAISFKDSACRCYGYMVRHLFTYPTMPALSSPERCAICGSLPSKSFCYL